MNEFSCIKCKSSNLVYEKFVKCQSRVQFNGSNIEYQESIIDEDDYLGVNMDSNVLNAENQFILWEDK